MSSEETHTSTDEAQTEDQSNGQTDATDESHNGVRRRAVIAGALGSPALLGIGFAVADPGAFTGSRATFSPDNEMNPVARAESGQAIVADMHETTTEIDEMPAQEVPTNQYRALHVDESILDELDREVGDQVRVQRDNDVAVYTIAGTLSEGRSVVRTTTEGKCRLAFYQDGEFEDERRWGPLRGDDTCDLVDEGFEVTIVPRVPSEDMDGDEAAEAGEFVEESIMGDDELLVLAPHGGRIAPYTVDQARMVADLHPDTTNWHGLGYGMDTSFYRWFVPSAEFSLASYPQLAEVAEREYEYAVSFHGVNDDYIHVGGTAPEELRQEIVDAIDEALPHDGSPVALGHSGYTAESDVTLVNRMTTDQSGGIWIGQPIADRRNYWDVIAESVVSVIQGR